MITSKTGALAIIGDPIEHSLTPRIQNAAWRELGLEIKNRAIRVTSDCLTATVRELQAEIGMLGVMVTIPHKEAVIGLCDELDDSARLMGVANLLQFRDDGRTVGHSSDGWAAVKSLREENVTVAGARIAILGGGGAARSLGLTLAPLAAETVILNRTVSRAKTIADEIARLGYRCRALPLDMQTLAATLPRTDLLVNATSIGMHPARDVSPVPAELLHSKLAVFDIVYNPLETRLLREARAAGAAAVDGLGMLIYTNVYAGQVCAGVDLNAATMRREALRALGAVDGASQ